MVRPNSPWEDELKRINLQIEKLLHTKKTIEAMLAIIYGPIPELETGEPDSPNSSCPVPLPPTNFPDSPCESLATGSGGIVPAAAIPLVYFGQSSELDREINGK